MDTDKPNPNSSEPVRPLDRAQDKQSPTGLLRFWQELKRRKVMRVAVTYAVMAWLIIQVASSTFGWFDIPKWAFQFVVIMLVTFFPVAIILAWAFELTPDGIKTTKVARDEASESSVSAKDQSKRTWIKIGFAAVAPTVIFGALAAFFYLQTRSSDHENAGSAIAQAEKTVKSIAVLPLDNLSPDPENAFFADGVQEDILTNLSKIEELLVISRSSTLRYREREKSLKEIGAELNARYVVEGSVRRAGNRVLVTVQLIDVETDAHLWADNFDRSLDDIFAIQAEIAKTIAEKLHAVISPETIAKIEYRPTNNQEAYDNWIKHRQLTETGGLGNWDEKIAFLEKALSLDPSFAEAWAQLSIERLVLWTNKGRKDTALLDKARLGFDQARSLKPGLPIIPHAQAHFAKVEERDLDRSVDLLLEALAIDPSFHYAQRILAANYRLLGRLADAQHHYEAALRGDPLSPRTNRELLNIYTERRMWNRARSLIRKNLERADGDVYWRRQLIDVDYLESGDRQRYLDALKALPDFLERPKEMAWHAIVSRNDASSFDDLRFLELPGRSLLTGFEAGYLLFNEAGETEQWPNALRGALNWLENYSKDNPNSTWYFGARAIFEALSGDRSGMESAVAKARELAVSPNAEPLGRASTEIKIAMAYIVLGDDQKAIETLESARQMRSRTPLNRQLDLWFIFDRLRGNPRFDKLLED